MYAGTASLSDASTSDGASIRRRLLKPDFTCSAESDQVVLGALKVQQQCKNLPKPYSFNTSNDVPEALGDLYISGFYQ